jgi:hypothetical protein
MSPKKSQKRPPKLSAPLDLARDCIKKGDYRDSRHASGRKDEREITLLEVIEVMNGGHREPSKDKYDEGYKSWSYAIRGRTIDDRDLRIAVAFEEADTMLLFVTAIDLEPRDS